MVKPIEYRLYAVFIREPTLDGMFMAGECLHVVEKTPEKAEKAARLQIIHSPDTVKLNIKQPDSLEFEVVDLVFIVKRWIQANDSKVVFPGDAELSSEVEGESKF